MFARVLLFLFLISLAVAVAARQSNGAGQQDRKSVV